MIKRRLFAIICPIVLALGFESLYFVKLNLFYIIIILSVLLVFLFLGLSQIINEKIKSRNFWSLAVLPILFYLTVTNYVLILGFNYLRHIIIIIFALILYAFLENLFLFYYHRAAYQINSLENSAVFLNILLFFLLALDLNALGVLLNPPLWLLSLIYVLVLFVLLWQLFWILKIKDKMWLPHILVLIILMLEFFWALSFLPTNFYVISALLTIFYYYILGVIRAKLANSLDKKIFLRYTVISLILILIIIITSHWL